jgi:hypothetical protein
VVDDFDFLGSGIAAKGDFDAFAAFFDCFSFDVGKAVWSLANKDPVI